MRILIRHFSPVVLFGMAMAALHPHAGQLPKALEKRLQAPTEKPQVRGFASPSSEKKDRAFTVSTNKGLQTSLALRPQGTTPSTNTTRKASRFPQKSHRVRNAPFAQHGKENNGKILPERNAKVQQNVTKNTALDISTILEDPLSYYNIVPADRAQRTSFGAFLRRGARYAFWSLVGLAGLQVAGNVLDVVRLATFPQSCATCDTQSSWIDQISRQDVRVALHARDDLCAINKFIGTKCDIDTNHSLWSRFHNTLNIEEKTCIAHNHFVKQFNNIHNGGLAMLPYCKELYEKIFKLKAKAFRNQVVNEPIVNTDLNKRNANLGILANILQYLSPPK